MRYIKFKVSNSPMTMDRPEKRFSTLKSTERTFGGKIIAHPLLSFGRKTLAGAYAEIQELPMRQRKLMTHFIYSSLRNVDEVNDGALIPDDRLERCTICHDPQNGPTNYLRFPVQFCPYCCHGFHRMCLNLWFFHCESTKRLCPMCRENIANYDWVPQKIPTPPPNPLW